MSAILPIRDITRQRLLAGAAVVAGISLLNLIPIEIGPFGSIWPIALLWPACGWSGLGPNLAPAVLLFVLGLWVDALTGTTLGTWALIALATHGVALLSAHYLNSGGLPPLVHCALTAAMMLAVMTLFGLWRHQGLYIVGSVLPLASAIGLYHYLGRLFELSEDET